MSEMQIADHFLKLVPLCSVTATLADRVVVPAGPAGTRAIVEVLSMRYEGARLKASMKGKTSADWIIIAPDGKFATVDVRCCIETDDGEPIFVQYNGKIVFSPEGQASKLIVAPRFEAANTRYGWLNRVQAIGVGSFYVQEKTLTYEFFDVQPRL